MFYSPSVVSSGRGISPWHFSNSSTSFRSSWTIWLLTERPSILATAVSFCNISLLTRTVIFFIPTKSPQIHYRFSAGRPKWAERRIYHQTLAGKNQQAVMNPKLWVYRMIVMRRARGTPLYQMHLDPRHLIEMINNSSMSHGCELIGNTLVIPSVLLDFGVEVCYTNSVTEVA